MHTIVIVFLFLLGVLLIVKGGDWFVDAATWMAEVSGIPKFIVGATIVSLATTLPELIVSALAAVEGKVDMAIGNAIGSVIANTGLILAISLLFMAGPVAKRQFDLKALLFLATAPALWVGCRTGSLTLVGSLLVFLIFLGYLVENIIKTREIVTYDATGVVEATTASKADLPRNLFLFVIGTVGIVVGARLLVDNGSELARILGVPENIIALTFVAIGTSLPELVTTLTAIVKKQSSLSVGNIIGANIIDMTLILPICAALSGGALPVGQETITLDLPAGLLLTAVAMLPPLFTHRFYKWQGLLLLLLYGGYLALILI